MTDETTNILVVDDLPEKMLVYESILEELGQTIVKAKSGEEALAHVLKADFAVILMDVNMPPGMNGFETAAMIRKRKKSAHTPIIFLTAFADEVRAAEGYAHGAVDYIPTPVVPAILRAKVRVFVDLYRMTQQVKRQADERVALAEERTKRAAAEEANRWLVFLTHAGAALGQSLDREVTARNAAGLAVPVLADGAALIFGRGGARTAITARPGGDNSVVEEGVDAATLDPRVSAAAEAALAGRPTGESGDILGLPLAARGRTFAALVLTRAAPRAFAPADVTVAQAYASRAAVALDNAQLHREVEDANRQKNEFLSMLAHELRNPLAPIRNAAQLLRLCESDPKRVGWAREVIDRQLAHMVRLVDDLLDVSRITQGKIRLQVEPVELGAVVAAAVEASRPLIDKLRHRLEVAVAHPIRVSGDPTRLTQVVSNLLNNAAKYTDEGGTIRLSVEANGGSAVVRVRDTGVGIPADLLGSVFDLFTQANRSLDRSQGGLGIGLTLVRRLVELHGGTVEAHSDGPGSGSEFVVRLPATGQAVAPQPSGPEPRPTPKAGLRLVVVDDHADGIESLADLLRLVGHEVAIAYDGAAGIDAVRRTRPDVVVLDIGLPGMDGFEVARRLRADPEIGPAVLVAVSGYGREADLRAGREAGFDHYFVKPVEFSALSKYLESLSKSRRESLAGTPPSA
ncbi:MAG TPA: response regulator [Gemmataceae bacterium]|nr:response regulator [Gemmataceae bacterium]